MQGLIGDIWRLSRLPCAIVSLIAALAIGVIALSFPLYELVRQEYIPSDVDEAEFDVNVTAPERAQPGGHG